MIDTQTSLPGKKKPAINLNGTAGDKSRNSILLRKLQWDVLLFPLQNLVTLAKLLREKKKKKKRLKKW